MKDTNTKKELWNAYRQASEMGMQLYKIAAQPTHPTLENERTNAAHLAYEYAKSIHAAIIDLEDGHTTDAKDMAHHYMSIAERFEREGMQQRTDLQFAATWEQRDALQLAAKASLTKATAWRYAACLLADENAIDITIGGAK